MKQVKQAQPKNKQGGKNMQQQPQQAISITQTCQPNEGDALCLYLKENGLSDLIVCVSPADPTDLSARSIILIPYLKTERTYLRLTYPCIEVIGKEFTAIALFTYKKKLIYDEGSKRVVQRFVKEGNAQSRDICALLSYDGRYYPFVIEGFRSKLNAVKVFLSEKRQRALLHPRIRIKHVLTKNTQGMDYPSFVIEIIEEHALTEREQRLYDMLRGHFQWRLGLQSFSPLYPPEVKQELEEEEDMNDVEGDDLITDF